MCARNHLLGESKLGIFASKSLIAQSSQPFPAMLHNAPFLMPSEDFTFQTRLIAWFESKKVYPIIVGEFDDGALLKSFGQCWRWVFCYANGHCRLYWPPIFSGASWPYWYNNRPTLCHYYRAPLNAPRSDGNCKGHRRNFLTYCFVSTIFAPAVPCCSLILMRSPNCNWVLFLMISPLLLATSA